VTITKSTIKEITSGNFNSLQRFLLEVHKKYHPKVKLFLPRKLNGSNNTVGQLIST